jgi:hypothetical protein
MGTAHPVTSVEGVIVLRTQNEAHLAILPGSDSGFDFIKHGIQP